MSFASILAASHPIIPQALVTTGDRLRDTWLPGARRTDPYGLSFAHPVPIPSPVPSRLQYPAPRCPLNNVTTAFEQKKKPLKSRGLADAGSANGN